MKIKDDVFLRENRIKFISELEQLLAQPSDKDERPCPGCRLTFPGNPSIKSTANCSAECIHAGAMMSSDPDQYPIEEHAVPLVYALYTMRLMMPCWSCEGHLNGQGEIAKLPKIWFYSASEFYPKLVASMLSDLYGYHVIKNEWQVIILPFSQSMFTLTYSIEPKAHDIHNLKLSSLHEDLKLIADNFRSNVLKSAEKYLESAKKSPFNKGKPSTMAS